MTRRVRAWVRRLVEAVRGPALRLPVAHHLKTWPDAYAPVAAGTKTFEFRRNDRDYRAGDVLVLQEWDPDTRTYTGHMVTRRVGFVLYGPAYGVPEGYAVLSLLPGELGCPPDKRMVIHR